MTRISNGFAFGKKRLLDSSMQLCLNEEVKDEFFGGLGVKRPMSFKGFSAHQSNYARHFEAAKENVNPNDQFVQG